MGVHFNAGVAAGMRSGVTAARAVASTLERLATGKRLNRAADDPSGMVAAEDLKVKEVKIRRSREGLQVESARLGATDGAQSVVQDLVLQLQSHVVATANTGGLSKDELQAHQSEVDSILDTIDFLSQTATHNGQQILTGLSTTVLGRGGGNGSQDNLASLRSGGDLNLLTGNLEDAQKVVEGVTHSIATQRAGIGLRLKDMDSQRSSLLTELENVVGARSKIEDADTGHEVAELLRQRTMQQVSTFMTNYAMQQQAGQVLSLLGVAA